MMYSQAASSRGQKARPPLAMLTFISDTPPPSCPFISIMLTRLILVLQSAHPQLCAFESINCSVFNVFSPFQHPLSHFAPPPLEKYPGSAIAVAGFGVGAVDPQPDTDASKVCVRRGPLFSHGFPTSCYNIHNHCDDILP